jgi:hypothetical protein
LSIVRFRPPPGRRTRPSGSRTRARSSLSPRAIVDVEIPVARATKAMPPRPRARASVAAHTRRDRSVSVGAKARYFARQPRRSTHRIYPPVAQIPSFIVLQTLTSQSSGPFSNSLAPGVRPREGPHETHVDDHRCKRCAGSLQMVPVASSANPRHDRTILTLVRSSIRMELSCSASTSGARTIIRR